MYALLLVATSPFLTPVAADQVDQEEPPQMCEAIPLTDEEQALRQRNLRKHIGTINNADVLVGVDALGRVLIAIDSDNNGLADRCRLLTASTRLEGPWSKRLVNAKVKEWNGAILIESAESGFAMTIAVEDARLPRPSGNIRRKGEVFEVEDAWELSRVDAQVQTTPLDSMDHSVIETWPENFWYDLLSPDSIFSNCTEISETCQAGGLGADGCGVGNNTHGEGCNVNGCKRTLATGQTVTTYFACCNAATLTQGSSCRCTSCYSVIGDPN